MGIFRDLDDPDRFVWLRGQCPGQRGWSADEYRNRLTALIMLAIVSDA